MPACALALRGDRLAASRRFVPAHCAFAAHFERL
jgi:hypothetical protein